MGQPSIGIRLKDQNSKPIAGSRVRVKLPDGHTKEGTTNDIGELEITGFTLDGPAQITFLDHTKPGKAEAPEWPEENEFKVTVVDEIGNSISVASFPKDRLQPECRPRTSETLVGHPRAVLRPCALAYALGTAFPD